jgi:hypothetical protein
MNNVPSLLPFPDGMHPLPSLHSVFVGRNVNLDQAEGAGMVMTFGMTLGLAAGSVLSLLLVYLI